MTINNRIIRRAGMGLTVGLVLGFMACDNGPIANRETNGPNVIAVVNDTPIMREKLEKELRLAKSKYRIKGKNTLPPEQWIWLKNNTLNTLIQETLLRQEATRNGIEVSQKEFGGYLNKVKQGYQEESFQQALEIEEISSKQWNQKLKTNLIINKLIERVVNSKVTVKEDELVRYFEENKGKFQKGEQVRALHIMVETEEEARDILKMLRKGKSFSDLAREHSLGLEGSEGGDMGYFEKGHMPEEFDDVFALKINKVSDIIRTPYGVHVFKVVDKKPERKMSFEESKKKIYDTLLRQNQERAFRNWLEEIKKNAQIKIKNNVLDQIK